MIMAIAPRKAKPKLRWIAVVRPQNTEEFSLSELLGLQFTSISSANTESYSIHYSHDAVIADIKYFSSSEHLKKLKSNFHGEPPSGVLLILNINPKHLTDMQISEIKQQLHLMVVIFKRKVPVHILLTHVENLTGFSSYIKGLSPAERKKSWGIIIDKTDEISEKFNTLYDDLCDQVVMLMGRYDEPLEVIELIQFPEQFISKISSVQPFLHALMSESPYHESPTYTSVMLSGALDDSTFFTEQLIKELVSKSWNIKSSLSNQYQRRFLVCSGLIACLLLSMILLALWAKGGPEYAEFSYHTTSKSDVRAVYEPLINKLIAEHGTVTLVDLLSAEHAGLFNNSNPIPVIFTKKAIRSKALAAIQLAAFSEDKQHENAMIAALMKAYFDDYINAWKLFMHSFTLKPVYDYEQLRTQFLILISEHSPVKKIVAFMIDNLDVPSLGISSSEFNAQVNRLMTEVKPLWHALNLEILSLTVPEKRAELSHMYAQKVLSSSEQTGLQAGVSNLSKILNEATDEPRAWVEPLLTLPFEHAWELILKEAAQYVESLWQHQLYSVYRNNIYGKFPFARTNAEAELSDVIDFFRPKQGRLPEFVSTVLQSYLTNLESFPEVITWLGRSLPVSTSFLDSLSQGLKIGKGLWGAGLSEPAMTFYIAPVPMPGVEEIVFEHNETLYRYRNEPDEWRKFTWLAGHVPQSASIYIARNGNKDDALLQYEGPWSLFHLLSQSQLTAVGDYQYNARWNLKTEQGMKAYVNLKIRTDKQYHLVTPTMLINFELPKSITSR